MGFADGIAYVIERCPRERQTLLFSATYPPGVAKLARRFLREPKHVMLDERHAATKIGRASMKYRTTSDCTPSACCSITIGR